MSKRHTTLGSRLRELRQQSKLSSKDVADAIGITQSHLCAIERGESPNPRFQVLQALANYFGLSISELVGENDEKLSIKARELLYWFDNRLSERDQELLHSMANQMQRQNEVTG